MGDEKPVLILHLSDLHLGKGELRAEDAKKTIAPAARSRIVERLGDYLRALPSTPHFVCVTGDVANQGDPTGFDDFLSWVKPLIEEGSLPCAKRFLITPGNHDVKRAPRSQKEMFAGFYRLARAFPHAFIPEHDPPPDAPAFELTDGLTGGVETSKRFGDVEVLRSEPFLYDPKLRVLIFAFNSSLACGVYPEESEELLKKINQALEMSDGDLALSRRLAALRQQAEEELLIDAGLIGEPQIKRFRDLMRSARDALGPSWDRTTKIALLHHHLNPIWGQQLELKPFESIIDSAQVKQALTEFNFDAVLHGHKHKNGVSLDATVVPTTEGRSADPIGIVSGGTVGGYPALNDRQTFKVMLIDSSRRAATVEEYPLDDAADPAEAMRKERRVYQLPLVDRIPDLHDDRSLKALLDNMLLEENASDAKAAAKTYGGEVALPGDSDLVAEAARYKFASVVDLGEERIFIDVILATSRLDFRQRARIHWMLVDVKYLGETTKTSPRIRLVIGNLAGTHFSRERISGEIERSIVELKACFQPAISAGCLELVERPIDQGEIDELDQTIPAAQRGQP